MQFQKALLTTILTLCLASALQRAQASVQVATIPDTPAGRQLTAYMRALDTMDSGAIQKYIESSFSKSLLAGRTLEEHVRLNTDFAKRTGGAAFQKPLRSSDYEITAFVMTRKDQKPYSINLSVEQTPPHAIARLGVGPLDPPEAASYKRLPAGKLTDAQIVAELRRAMDERVKADLFSGTVLVAKDGKPLMQKAYGLAHRGFNIRNKIDTKFNLGSMNKMFTAVAVAQLVEKGKISYQTTVGKILPDYPNKDAAAKVTVHHLLTHTSGLADYFNEKFVEASRDRFRTVKDYLPLFQDKPLEFEPGARFRYSNAGFMLLGAIVEKVSGRNYFDYVRENIYKPAGMTNSDSYDLDLDTPNLAFGYTNESFQGPISGPRRNNLFLHVIKGGPAGGGYSTVQDLLKFDQALRSGKLISAESISTLMTTKSEEGSYGYGFQTRTVDGQRIAGHGGGFPGINSELEMYLDSGYTVAVMSNYDPPAAQKISGLIRHMLLQK